MNPQLQAVLAALAIESGEKVLTINQLRAELQQAQARIADLETDLSLARAWNDETVPA